MHMCSKALRGKSVTSTRANHSNSNFQRVNIAETNTHPYQNKLKQKFGESIVPIHGHVDTGIDWNCLRTTRRQSNAPPLEISWIIQEEMPRFTKLVIVIHIACGKCKCVVVSCISFEIRLVTTWHQFGAHVDASCQSHCAPVAIVVATDIGCQPVFHFHISIRRCLSALLKCDNQIINDSWSCSKTFSILFRAHGASALMKPVPSNH